jgi:transposase
MKLHQNYLSTPIKWQIVKAKEAGQTDRQVAAQFGVHYTTISRIFNKYRNKNDVSCRPKSGRPRKYPTIK